MNTTNCAVAVWLLVTLFAAGDVLASTTYRITDLGLIAGNDARSINDFGQVTGAKDFGLGYRAFLYSGGVVTDLGVLSQGDSASFGISINNAGQIAGNSQQSNGRSWAFIYSGGVMTRIPGLGGNVYDFANGINNFGQVVGISGRLDGVTHAYLHAGGVTTDLGNLTGSGGYSNAYAINDQAQIVGVSTNAAGHDRGFLWQNGVMTDLGDLAGGAGYTRVYAINNLGQIAGERVSVTIVVSLGNFSRRLPTVRSG